MFSRNRIRGEVDRLGPVDVSLSLGNRSVTAATHNTNGMVVTGEFDCLYLAQNRGACHVPVCIAHRDAHMRVVSVCGEGGVGG